MPFVEFGIVPLPVGREIHDPSFASSAKIEEQSLDPRTA
jgi:hypothetical protein